MMSIDDDQNAGHLLDLTLAESPDALWSGTIAFLRDILPHELAIVRWNGDRMIFASDESLHIEIPGPYDLTLGDIYNRLGFEMKTEFRFIDQQTFLETGLHDMPLLNNMGCAVATAISIEYQPTGHRKGRHTSGIGSLLIPSRIDFVLYHKSGQQTSEQRKVFERLFSRFARVMTQFLKTSAVETLIGSLENCLRDIPIGLIFLDSHLNPLFANREGIRQAYLWREAPHGKLRSDLRQDFELPEDIFHVLQDLYFKWSSREESMKKGRSDVAITNALDESMKVVISCIADPARPLHAPNYVVRFSSLNGRLVDQIEMPTPLQLSLLAELTAAERSVAAMVLQGLTNQEVAAKLHRQTSTVKDHLTNIYAKLGINSRVQLLRLLSGWTKGT